LGELDWIFWKTSAWVRLAALRVGIAGCWVFGRLLEQRRRFWGW